MFLHDLAGTRYSPLNQINAGNVSRLTQAWFYSFNREGKTIHGLSPFELYQEITPIVVDGVMYLPSGDRVVALDPETGKELWTYELGDNLASFRGVTYWPGDRSNPARVIFTTAHKMMALNARTGKIDPGFGREGEVPLEVAYDGAPIVYKNMLLLGTNFYGPGERIRRSSRPGGNWAMCMVTTSAPASNSGNSTPFRGRARLGARRG